ncbi:MAG TPA: Crp/Fnr family transcriptional regulator [Pyrinomonadaceae bacterium]|nr:Crp/Fnr family transcriptional regulator [Pyrinomonadaceae bacterium]
MLPDVSKPRPPINNHLLSALPPKDFLFIERHLESLSMVSGTMLADYCDPIQHCYFPNNGMISLLSVLEDGSTCEVGYIGFEGVVGMSAIFGKNEMPYQALVQARSEGFRVPIEVVAELFRKSPIFHDISLQFTYVVLRQFAQTSACNRFHTAESRLCRWFSVMCERSGNSHLTLTQEFLAYMLGVQRTSIGTIANNLQENGIIKYSRGRIEVLDLEGLKSQACECFDLIKSELREFLAGNKSPYMSTTRQTVQS